MTDCPDESATGWMGAVARVAAKTDQPERTRMNLLARIQMSNGCFPNPTNQQEYDAMAAVTGLTEPTHSQNGFGPRFYTVTKCWFGAGGIGDAGRSQPAQLTYSFPDDGVNWGGAGCTINPNYGTGPNDLGVRLIGMFSYLDRGREMMRSSLAAWRKVAGLTYNEVADDNSAMDMVATPTTARGDIRMGGWAFSAYAPPAPLPPLAYNGFPSESGICSGADMTINTAYFYVVGQSPASLNNQYINDLTGNWLYFRNMVAHEHGHGLGMQHTVPCNQTKLMEPSISLGPILLSPDEVRGAIRNYGDRYSPLNNHYSNQTKDFGNLTTPVVRSIFERDLGVNGRVIVGGFVEDDYFKFTIDSTQNVTISVIPTGYSPTGSCCVGGTCTTNVSQINCTGTWILRGSCSSGVCVVGSGSSTCTAGGGYNFDPNWCQGLQVGTPSNPCGGTISTIEAQKAADLAVTLLQANGTTVIETSNSPTLGVPETITRSAATMNALPAGTYVVQVWDAASGTVPNNQVVQTYDLMIRVGTSKSAPVAIAGLNSKRAQANQRCYFIGSHNSYATDNGTSIPPANYDWDLDGNGSFETTGNPQPFTTYVSNGTYPVMLRVTDSNGQTGTDTIQVTVWGATTSITSVPPFSGNQGATVPVTINGTNFKGVTTVAVSGTGVNVIGTPSVNAMGTTITGLSFVIDPAAATGPRNVSITNTNGPGGLATGLSVFTVNSLSGACCAADGSCTTSTSGGCGGSYQGNGTICTPNPCPQPTGACCAADGSCTTSTSGGCGGSYQGNGTTCTPNPCPQPTGACCAADGSCTVSTSGGCGGSYQGNGTTCTPNPCPQPTGACCAADGSCTVSTSGGCGGSYQGNGTTCTPNPCPQPTGACCNGATCSVVAQAACAGINRRYVGNGTACNGVANFVSPCCAADFNQDGVRNVSDIFAYLTAWFASDLSADINGGGVAVNDIFSFLSAWFAGC